MTSGNFQAVNFESLNATIFVCTALGLFSKMLESTGGLREVCGKSKWKFKMAFAMKGGGGLSRGSRLPLSYFEK